METTLISGYPFPEYQDQPDGASQLRALAEAVEQDVILKFPDAIARDAVVTAPQRGQLVLLTTTTTLTKYGPDGWKPYWPKGALPLRWNALPLTTGWASFPGDWQTVPPGYVKDQLGWVRMRGMIRNVGPNFNSTPTTLPSGYRPPKALRFVTERTTNTFQAYDVTAAGQILYEYAPTASVYMDLGPIYFDPTGGS